MLTVERLKECLSYSPDTGVFTWLVAKGRCAAGTVAGSLHSSGYVHIRIDGVKHQAQRLAWLYMTGENPGLEVGFADGVKTNLRLINLRMLEHAEHVRNQTKPHARSITGILGVHPEGKGFRSRVQINGKQVYLGHFSTVEEAICSYEKSLTPC